jgi:hypothetical protein
MNSGNFPQSAFRGPLQSHDWRQSPAKRRGITVRASRISDLLAVEPGRPAEVIEIPPTISVSRIFSQ